MSLKNIFLSTEIHPLLKRAKAVPLKKQNAPEFDEQSFSRGVCYHYRRKPDRNLIWIARLEKHLTKEKKSRKHTDSMWTKFVDKNMFFLTDTDRR